MQPFAHPRRRDRRRPATLVAALLALTVGAAVPPAGAHAQDAAKNAKKRPLPLEVARVDTFTTSTGTWISLDVSPDGSRIVFDLLGDLYLLPIDGGTAERLTSGMAYDVQPRFSPDGERIAFVSDRSGGDNVWLLDLATGDTTQLTTGNDNLYVSPEWTPDGGHIVASKGGGLGGAHKLWLYDVDGGRGLPLSATPTPPANLKMVGAAYGPDPRYLWFAARTGDWQYNSIGPQYQLYVWDRESGRTSQMTTRFGSGARPALSPDGRWLVYATRFETETGLRLRDLRTQDERWLAFPVQHDDMESRAPMDAYPGYSFTPDSKAVIASYGGEIWRVPVAGGEAAKIPFTAEVHLALGPEVRFDYAIDTAPTFTARQVRDIAPSPDGSRLAFVALDRVWVQTLPDGTPRRVTSDTVGEFMPAWSPDGRSLAYVTWHDAAGGSVRRATARGDDWRVTTLSGTTALFTDVAWAPDGERLVVVRAAARELQEAGGAFFGPAAATFVELAADGSGTRDIMPTAGLGNPHFTQDAERIYAYGRGGLQSFRFDGTDLRTHLRVTAPPARGGGAPHSLDADMVARAARQWVGGRAARPMDLEFADRAYTPDFLAARHLDDEPQGPRARPASLVLMAPTGDRALAMVGMDLYTMPVPRTGANAPSISVGNPAAAPVPVRKLNTIGGEFPAWHGDGRRVSWALGNAVWTYDLDRAKAVDDSIAAEKKRVAAIRADTTKRDSLARADSLAKADTTAAKEKKAEGYEPAERRIAVTGTRDQPRGTLVLRGAKAITMRGDEIIEDADIVVRDRHILAVGPRGTVDVPDGARVMDVSGKVVMPGLVDTHYHPQWLTPQVHNTQTWQYLATLAYGTTTTRDPQTATTDFLSYSDQVESGAMIGPRIYTTGPGVFSSEPVRDLDHAREILTRYAEYYDTKTLKMYMSGNRQQRQWIIMAAKELGIMPTTEGGLDQKINLTHGIDGYPGIEHTLPITPKFDDVLQWYSATQVTNSPTLVVAYGGPFGEGWFYQTEDLLGDAKLRHFTHPVDFDSKVRRRGSGNAPGPAGFAVREEYPMWRHAEDLARTVAKGGRIGVGSHGQLQGLGMHWELWLVQAGGMPEHDALKAATIVGAEAIGLGGEVGSLEPGKFADLLVLDADPLADIRNTNTIRMVMKNGRLYDGGTLDELHPRQRPLARQPWAYEKPAAAAGIATDAPE